MDQNIQKPQGFQETPVPASTPIDITRTFNAPVEQVYRAWSDAETVKQWWGPEGYSCPLAKIDFRSGGRYLLAMKNDADGQVTWGAGAFEEIIPNKKISYSDSFSDEKGNIISSREAGLPFDFPMSCRVLVEFSSPAEGQTTLHLRHEGIPSNMHDDCTSGWNSSLDKFQRLVEKH